MRISEKNINFAPFFGLRKWFLTHKILIIGNLQSGLYKNAARHEKERYILKIYGDKRSPMSETRTTQKKGQKMMKQIYNTIKNFKGTMLKSINRLARLTVVAAFVVCGSAEVWSADCKYTVNDFVSSKKTEKNGDTYKILWSTYYYYDVPTFEFGNVTNDYGISHVKLSLKFSGAHLVTEDFNLQYKVNDNSWKTIQAVSVRNTESIDTDVSITGAVGQKVYFRLARAAKAKFTDVQTLTLSGFEVRMKPTMSATPTSIDFGEVTYGNSASEEVTAYYTLKASGTMTVECTGDFSATVSGSCSCSTAQQSKTVTVKFTPTTAGNRTGKLTITNPDGTTKATVTLKGVGVRADQTLTMKNGNVFATTDKNSPTLLDLSTLISKHIGNGDVSYKLVAPYPKTMNNKSAKDSCKIDGSNFHAWVAGEYKLLATATQTGQYKAVTSDTITVTVKKNVTTIKGTTSYNMMVDSWTEIVNYEVKNTSYATPKEGDSNDFYYTLTQTLPNNAVTTGCAAGHESDVIGYDAYNHKITTYNQGTAKLTLTQKETDVYTGKTITFKVSTYKYNCVFSDAVNLDAKVEETVQSNYVLTYTKPNDNYIGSNYTAGTPTEDEESGNWCYTKVDNITTDKQANCPAAYKDVVISYAADTKKATGRNQGVSTISLYQKETYKCKKGSTSFTVNVTKNDNALSYKWNGGDKTSWSETMGFDEISAFTFSGTNTKTNIDINQIGGNEDGNVIASYSKSAKKVTSYYNKGQAVWALYQDENYKYKAASAQFAVTVKEKECETCYAYKLDPNDKVSNVLEKHGDLSWGVDSVANVLTFAMKKNGTIWGDNALLSLWVKDKWMPEDGPIELAANNLAWYEAEDPIQLDPHTSKIKFEKGGDIVETSHGDVRTDDPYINNIRVSRLTWLELNSTQTEQALDTLYIRKQIGEANKKATFQLKISTCDTIVKLASNKSNVTLSETSIVFAKDNTYDGGYASENITVTYTCNHKDTTVAVISAYTQYEHKTFVVKAITKANDQEIIWKDGFEGDVVSLPISESISISDAASASSGLIPVLYRTDNPAVIEIAADSMSFKVIAPAQATLIARQEGNDEYEYVEDSKIIQGTEKIIQSIVWEDNFTRGMIVGDSKKMNASVDTLNRATDTYDHSDARTAKLVYSCPANNGVIEIVDSCYIHILAEGTTTVTAYVQGDSRYEAATYTKRVAVHPASEGCESHYVYLQKSGEKIQFFADDINMPEIPRTFVFSSDSGVPDKVSFSLQGVSYKKLIKKYFAKDILVYQSTDGANWAFVDTVKAYKDSTVFSGDLQLSRDAKMIKLVRPQGGQGYHYIENLTVTRLQYLEPIDDIIDLGDVPSGSVRGDIISLKYSEMRGDLSVEKGDGDETYNKLELDDDLITIECGSFGQKDLGFTFRPAKVGAWSQTVKVTEPISKQTFTVTIKANVIKGAQSIEWNPEQKTFYTVQGEEFNAQLPKKSNRNLDVILTSLNTSVVSFSGTTATINGAGKVTIEATCAGNDNYHAADKVSQEYTINRTPTAIITPPTIIGTVYAGAPASSVSLNTTSAVTQETVKNGVVEGTYSITSPAVFTEGACDITITFTPTNEALYEPCTTTITSVEVEPAYIFTGKIDTDWMKVGNWESNAIPTLSNDVTIAAAVVIDTDVEALSLTITTGSVTINPTGGLTVGAGGVSGASASNLTLKAGTEGATKGETGYLRISPEYTGAMPEATVELYSIAYYDMEAENRNEIGRWQFVGSPIAESVAARSVFSKNFLYDWDVASGEWKNNIRDCQLQPFQGYATSQYRKQEGWLISYTGSLVPNTDKTFNLAYNEGEEYTHNMIANSYSAPIDVTKFDDDDFHNMQGAIYIFNTGSRADMKKLADAKSGSVYTPGQYITIPIGTAGAAKAAFDFPTTIAPMQGICVHATGEGATLKFDYEKLVWNGDYKENPNAPLHAPARRQKAEEQVNSLCVSLYGEEVADNLYLLESDNYDASYENGYDAIKMESGEANIFSVVGDVNLAMNATNSMIGTQIGVRTGETAAYTLVFTHFRSENDLALRDFETGEVIEIKEGQEYTFYAEPNSVIKDRFQIIAYDNMHGVTTGSENIEKGTKVHKFIQDNQLYILKDGVLYNASGARVR